jgi:hypothetical protein
MLRHAEHREPDIENQEPDIEDQEPRDFSCGA